MRPIKRVAARGKRLLTDAALRLLASSHSFQGLGLRELAREAGLNPNTFYRHFKTLDDLGLELIDQISRQLREPLRQLRREASAAVLASRIEKLPAELGFDLGRGRRVTHESVTRFFDFVLEHPDAFIVGVRELYGSSTVLRQGLQKAIDGFAADLSEDIRELELLPGLDAPTIDKLSRHVMLHLFLLSLDYIEAPVRRSAIIEDAEEYVAVLFAGAMLLHLQAGRPTEPPG